VLKVEIVHESGAVSSIDARRGQSLLHALFEGHVWRGRAVCAGSGLCGKCAVRFFSPAPEPCAEDEARLGTEKLAAGWRLACRHAVSDACRIELSGTPMKLPECGRGEALAVDLGTTRIKWAVKSGSQVGPECTVMNPQMAVGSEIMSRLRYAMSSPEAREHLRGSVLEILSDVAAASGATTMALSANSTMVSLLLDVPLEGLAFAPYSLPWSGGETLRLSQALPPAYVPPLLGPFIGADVSSGLAYITSLCPTYPFVLADLGTNGEFVLALDSETYFATSVPMGPAIEGVGLCCGAAAGHGVLSRAELGPFGLRWNGQSLNGISGTGYVSLLALLLRLGVVGMEGHFQSGTMPLAQRVGERVRAHALGRVLVLDGDIFLAERDIEEFLKAKAGVNVALKTLVDRAGLTAGDVEAVYLAGALGEHALPEDLCTLGFLPEIWRDRIHVAGNTSLAGTVLALGKEEVRSWLEKLPARVRVVSLVEGEEFGSAFMRAMRFAWA
jgi:uncharacterized 2Fe-2S/4Fe-4S cluster protein (DUF4445 family)